MSDNNKSRMRMTIHVRRWREEGKKSPTSPAAMTNVGTVRVCQRCQYASGPLASFSAGAAAGVWVGTICWFVAMFFLLKK
jgi:hypothetical protein